MDLKQLRSFLAVADHGSLSRAADALHIAQPALGRQIRMLEDDLGVTLFDRHGRGMAVTATGRLLVARAQTILRIVDDARAEISSEPSAVTGAVTLGVPPTVGEVLAGRLVERFLKRYPAVTVRIVPAFSGYLYDLLRRGEVDLAVMYQTPEARQIESQPLIDESLWLVGATDKMAGLPRHVPFSQLAGKPLILPGPRQGLRLLLERQALKADIALNVVVEADALQTLKDLVGRGIGLTVLPKATVQIEIEARRLQAAMISDPELTRSLVLARSLARPASNTVRIFAETLKAETMAMIKDGAWDGVLLMETP